MGEILRLLLAVCIPLLLASCGSLQRFAESKRAPSVGFRYQEVLVDETFGDGKGWRSYDDGADLFLGVRDGAYLIDFSGRQYVWTQGQGPYADIVIEADVRQTSDYDNNAFGLACRLDLANSGRGYFFLISGDGYASIRWSNGRVLEPIVSAAPASPVNRGQARNRMRVVCIDDYLALWVNGKFVAEARDRRADTGAVGMAAVMNYAGRRLAVAYDDLKVWSAAFDGATP